MSNQRDVLLLGNGINYLSKNSMSWTQLLKELATEVRQTNIMDLVDDKPFTLIYEEIVLRSKAQGISDEIAIKRKVAGLLTEIGFNEFHNAIIGSRFSQVITTNYDYSLERAHGESSKNNVRRETKYSLFRRRQFDDQYVWHIHGECDSPGTIMLGHEQYAGQLQNMRNYVTADRKKKSGKVSHFKLRNLDFDTDGSLYSWIDLFLRDNVHILGLSLDYTEIDLWWLLSYKERLRQMSGYDVGDTYFHSLDEHKVEDKKRAALIALMSILKSFGVLVRKYNDYPSMYEAVIR